MQVINKGRNGFVGIGFSAADVSLDRLPGWETHSFGYHGDDGHAFHHSGKGRPYGPTFGTGKRRSFYSVITPGDHYIPLY